MKTNNSKMILVTRWNFDVDAGMGSPETSCGKELPIGGQDDLIANPKDEQASAADYAEGIESRAPAEVNASAPIHSDVGEWIIEGLGFSPTRWSLMDPNAPNVDRLAESFSLHGVVKLIVF